MLDIAGHPHSVSVFLVAGEEGEWSRRAGEMTGSFMSCLSAGKVSRPRDFPVETVEPKSDFRNVPRLGSGHTRHSGPDGHLDHLSFLITALLFNIYHKRNQHPQSSHPEFRFTGSLHPPTSVPKEELTSAWLGPPALFSSRVALLLSGSCFLTSSTGS